MLLLNKYDNVKCVTVHKMYLKTSYVTIKPRRNKVSEFLDFLKSLYLSHFSLIFTKFNSFITPDLEKVNILR